MMGLPDGWKIFKTGLVVLIQYRLWQTATQPARHVAVAKTRYAIASRQKALRETQTLHAGYASITVPNLKRIALFVQKLLGVTKFRNWVTWRRPRPFRGRFIFHTQAGSVLHLCIKFEADCSIRSKVIKVVPKLGN